MACNKDLQAEGKVYPRTCADCALGPCTKYPMTPIRPATPRDLAALIVSMNYGTLLNVAAEFASMIDKEVRPKVETKEEFADLLFDWADAQS